MRIAPDTLERIKALKIHPRVSLDEVLRQLLDERERAADDRSGATKP